jgi:hypothetical protein
LTLPHVLAYLAAVIIGGLVLMWRRGKPKASRPTYWPACGTADLAVYEEAGSLSVEFLLWLLLVVPGIIPSRLQGTRTQGAEANSLASPLLLAREATKRNWTGRPQTQLLPRLRARHGL